MKSFDVIIVGGGISGSIAAIASARSGAKTLLIEQYGFLGGALTACGVGPMMTFHAGEKQVVQGITGELIERMKQKGLSPGHIYDTTTYTYTVTPFDSEGMKHELEKMLLESGGEILYHTMLAGVNTKGSKIESITICNKGGLSELSASVYVDATGDADLSAWAGVEVTKGRPIDGKCQPMTMKLKVSNVDVEQIKNYIRENPQEFPTLKMDTSGLNKAPRLSIGGFMTLFANARERGSISFLREWLLIFETNTLGEIIINTSRVTDLDPIDPWQLSQAEIEGRQQVSELMNFIKGSVPGFQKANWEFSGPAIGIRSSRQIRGLHLLDAYELLESKKFDDVIAHGGYPIDIHPAEGLDSLVDQTKIIPFDKRELKWGQVYNIPYGCLVNHQIDNIITVGRCISATYEAQGGIRVTPIAGAIGHAGGAAAAISALDQCATKNLNIKKLQEHLKLQGAYLEI